MANILQNIVLVPARSDVGKKDRVIYNLIDDDNYLIITIASEDDEMCAEPPFSVTLSCLSRIHQ